MATVALKQTATDAGFSEGSVSRVLRGHGGADKIRPETEQAVFRAARGVGYIRARRVFEPKALAI